MFISLFELFSIGIGPSSSHTIGPMRAAKRFAEGLVDENLLVKTARVQVELFGSLAHTAHSHGVDKAIISGWQGYEAETIDPSKIDHIMSDSVQQHQLNLLQQAQIDYRHGRDFHCHLTTVLSEHPNGMRFSAYDASGESLQQRTFYSIGGGGLLEPERPQNVDDRHRHIPFPFANAEALLALCEQHNLSIDQLMLANEQSLHSQQEIDQQLDNIIQVMAQSIENGCQHSENLPGGLDLRRRACRMYQQLHQQGKPPTWHTTDSLKWLNLYALAVSEENAAGNRIVTAPTNGAAGIIPAVMMFYHDFFSEVGRQQLEKFLLTAAAIGVLYKRNASISGAEVGCQGEVGVASSMAAAALAACLGGSIHQAANAAEIAMEHHLGMTCDPIKGLVQIPCIERNAMGAVKAVNAAYLALEGEGQQFVSLYRVIDTMYRTGLDMSSKYKETALGGLAVNLPNC
ncbi:MAG: L-serine ammonia-lyase [Gammaproteobacteria bacterium]|nr:L-serine ammonia-lyase [Gammaproteobacteria bacterium]